MGRRRCFLWLLVVLTASPSLLAHTLFGDLNVAGESEPLQSITFQLTLENRAGRTVDRQMITPGGRYRFLNVPNGDYVLVIEHQNRVVARMEFRIDEFRPTDIRKNIDLAWENPKNVAPSPDTVVHARSPENEKRLKDAGQKMSQGKETAAKKTLEKLLAEDEADFEAWTELGSVHFRLKEWKEAENAYTAALKLQPTYLPALLNLGKMRIAAGKADTAVEPLVEAVRLNPDSAEAQYFLGEAYLAIKKGSLAVGHLEKAIELEPDKMADVHLRLGALYEGAGMKPRAAEEYRRYLEKRPNSDRAAKLRRFVEEYGHPTPR